jgi:hypothetical protein
LVDIAGANPDIAERQKLHRISSTAGRYQIDANRQIFARRVSR